MFHVLQRIWSIHRKSDENDMGFGICQRSQALVIFLSCRIPKSQLDRAAVDSAIRHVVFKYCRHLAEVRFVYAIEEGVPKY
jgi:hypothetical protein